MSRHARAEMAGHKVSGWICSECGVVGRPDGVAPEIRVERLVDGTLSPVLYLWAADGHAQSAVLGWENLDIIRGQLIVAQAEDPIRGPELLRRVPAASIPTVLARVAANQIARGDEPSFPWATGYDPDQPT